MEKLPSSNSVTLSMLLKGCENSTENEKADSLCIQKQIVNNQQLVCGTQKFLDRKKCTIYRPFECAERNETCVQIGQSNEGECNCLEGLSRDANNVCSEKEPSVSSTASASIADNTTVPTVPDLTEKDCEFLEYKLSFGYLNLISSNIFSCCASRQHRCPDPDGYSGSRLTLRSLQAWVDSPAYSLVVWKAFRKDECACRRRRRFNFSLN